MSALILCGHKVRHKVKMSKFRPECPKGDLEDVVEVLWELRPGGGGRNPHCGKNSYTGDSILYCGENSCTGDSSLYLGEISCSGDSIL